MLGVRCVALRCVALRGVACVALESRCPGASLGMGTALLISSFCWLPHRSSARKRGDNCKGRPEVLCAQMREATTYSSGAAMRQFGTTQPYRLYIVRFFSSCKPSVTHICNT